MRIGYSLNPVFLSDPVAPHPLNEGRLAWWLTVPGWDGGRQWLDLMGLHPGTLTNMGSGSGWQATTRPGGFGQVNFDGSDDSIQVASSAIFDRLVSGLTLSLWINPTNYSNFNGLIARTDNFSPGSWDWYLYQNSGIPTFNGNLQANSAPPTGQWSHLAVTFDGATATHYLNGLANGSGAPNLYGATPNPVIIGNRGDGFTRFTGSLDDANIWSRPLSASEIRAVYEESLRGYPGTLNRIGPSVFLSNVFSSFSESVNHSLTFSPTITFAHDNLISVNHSLTFSPSLFFHHVNVRLVSQSLSFTSTPNILSSSLFDQHINQVLTFSCVLTSAHAQRFRLLQILSFSPTISAHRSQNYCLSQSLVFSSSPSRNIISHVVVLQSLSLTSRISLNFILHKSFSQSLSLSSSLLKARYRFFTVSGSFSFSQNISSVRFIKQLFSERLVFVPLTSRNIDSGRTLADFLNVYGQVNSRATWAIISVSIPTTIPQANQYQIQLYRHGRRLLLPRPRKFDVQLNMQNVIVNGRQKFMPRATINLYLDVIPDSIGRFTDRNIIMQNERYEMYSGYLYQVSATQLEFDGVRIT